MGASRIRAGRQSVAIDAVGPQQAHLVLNAVIRASTYLQDSKRGGPSFEGKQLLITPEKTVTGETRVSVLRLHVQALPEVQVAKGGVTDLRIAEMSNTGKLGGALVWHLKQGDKVTMGGMGPQCTNNAFKAMLIAQRLGKSILDGSVLAVSVKDEKVTSNKEERTLTVLSCRKAPVPSSLGATG